MISWVEAGLARFHRNDCSRRNLAVAVPFGEGPFTTRFADLRHRAVKVGGLLDDLLPGKPPERARARGREAAERRRAPCAYGSPSVSSVLLKTGRQKLRTKAKLIHRLDKT